MTGSCDKEVEDDFGAQKLVPCMHIYAYYQYKWENQKCIAYNLLRRGYLAWASKKVISSFNNLYEN